MRRGCGCSDARNTDLSVLKTKISLGSFVGQPLPRCLGYFRPFYITTHVFVQLSTLRFFMYASTTAWNTSVTSPSGVTSEYPWHPSFSANARPSSSAASPTVSYTHLTLPTNREV